LEGRPVTASLQISKSLYQQIGSLLEKRILAGEFNPGDRLPTTQELADQFGVTLRTAQQGAALLHRRGLVERIPGRGTFVSNRLKSRTIGIVFGKNPFGNPAMLFFQRLYGKLCAELKRLDWGVKLYFPADKSGSEQMLTELAQDIDHDKLRGIIPVCTSNKLNTWLNEHPGIPHRPIRTSAPTFDELQHHSGCRGIRYLLERGYCRIAVVMHTETSSPKIVEHVKEHIALAYAEHGRPMQATFYEGCFASHAAGVAQTRRILAAPEGPSEAILALNDQGCMGIIFELMCRNLRIPQDIALMTTSNSGIEIPCPVALTRLECDQPAIDAHNEVERLFALLEDREAVLVPVHATLVLGESCGEKS
jgi:DNA-binding LacI/PurR family transcriptional regulator